MSKTFEARIYTEGSCRSVDIEVEANDSVQARHIIEMKPEFKGFAMPPHEKR